MCAIIIKIETYIRCNSSLFYLPSNTVKKALRDTQIFFAGGTNGIQIFCWKKYTFTNQHLARIFTLYSKSETLIPQWLVLECTTLLPKKGVLSNLENYRLITCLITL